MRNTWKGVWEGAGDVRKEENEERKRMGRGSSKKVDKGDVKMYTTRQLQILRNNSS